MRAPRVRCLICVLWAAASLLGQGAPILTEIAAGGIRLGQSVASLQEAYGAAQVQIGKKTASGCLVEGSPFAGLRVEAGEPYDGKDENQRRIIRIQAVAAPWATAEGLKPGATLQDAERCYGPLLFVDRYTYGREEAHFARQPDWIHLVLDEDGALVGDYAEGAGRAERPRPGQSIRIRCLEIEDQSAAEITDPPRRLRFLFGGGDSKDLVEPAWEFFWRLKRAAAAGDAARISRMVAYPLKVSLHGRPALIRTRSSFLAHSAAILNARVKESIRRQRFDQLFANAQGVMIGRGEVWLVPDEDQGRWVFRIHTFNNGSFKSYGAEAWFGPDDGTSDHPWDGRE